MLAGKKLDPCPKMDEGRSNKQSGALFGVGKSYVSEAKKIKEENPDLAEKILAGK